ncbi:MAG TPA: carboxypeptidase-like regulatory domain-containing protein, partial [Blastocatellia bacterium]|nr:carboxypeptidase-like regulatory domain-containing protein [Blastocatellia bacterium]
MKNRYRVLAVFFALALATPCRLRAQAIGEILGTITDQTGAVVPMASVTAVQAATGLRRSTVSSTEGTYAIPQLPVGAYDVTVDAKGFKRATTTGITLDVSQQRVLDFSLTLPGAQTTVEVSAAPPLLTTTNGSLGGLVTGQQVQTLPLNGRAITNLVMLQPGLTQETNSTGWQAPEWAGNGNRGQTEVATLDNIDTSDAEMGNVQFWNFNLDAIAEFKVLQNNYSAEFGQGAGTIVQMVSKSGTNQFHGSAFEFDRNSVVDARNFFSSSVPPFQRNEFGGTFGGPIKKDKTFFFAEYAGFRQRLGEPTVMAVPTAQERQGIVTVTGSNNQSEQLTVPLNPIAQNILNSYPMPNNPTGPDGPRTYNVQFKQPSNDDQFSVRGDQTFSSRDTMFVRASYINNRTRYTDPVAASENPLYSSTTFNNPRNYAVTETHIFSPTLLNVFSFGLNREVTGVSVGTQAFPQEGFADGSLANYGPDNFITKYVITQFIPQDKVTWTRGRNTFDIGAQFRRVRDNGAGVSTGGPNGIFQFTPGTPLPAAIPVSGGGSLPAGSPSPNSLVSFIEGAPSAYIRATGMPGFSAPGNPAPYGVRVWHLNSWFQDDIQLTPRLTVNLGFRYEYNSVPTESGSRLNAIVDDPSFGGGHLFGQLILNPSQLYRADYRGFGPRFGIAERLGSRTVLRGGFGIFTNDPPTVFPDQAEVNFPLASFSTTNKPTFSATPLSVAGLPVVTSLSGQPMPPQGNNHLIPPNTPVNLAPIAAFFGGPITTNLTSLNFKNGYTMAGNATLEEQLPGAMALQLSYALNNAVGLYGSEWPNAYNGAEPQYAPYTAVNPGLGEFQLTDNHAHSTYNALQVQLRKISAEHGFQFQVAYTYS